jgi:hypothetical protein
VNVGSGLTTWGPTTLLKNDVQGWVNNPASNAGWILRGDEGTDGSACRFDSKELVTVPGGMPPTLTVQYDVGALPTHFEDWLALNYPDNFVGQYVNPDGDDDGDGIKNQIEYAYALSPVMPNPADAGLQASSMAVFSDTQFTYYFRRDTLAADLTYLLQTSGDLTNWTTIAQSVGGGVPTGSGFVTEGEAPGEPTISIVTARETVASPANRFVRLRVLRAP